MIEQTCGTCRHYEPHRDPVTKRIRPSMPGACGWRPEVTWSMAYRRSGYGSIERDPKVYPVDVWKNTDAKTCACYEDKS